MGVSIFNMNLIKVMERNQDDINLEHVLLAGYVNPLLIDYISQSSVTTKTSSNYLVQSFYANSLAEYRIKANVAHDFNFSTEFLEQLAKTTTFIYILPKSKAEANYQFTTLLCKLYEQQAHKFANLNVYVIGANDSGIKSLAGILPYLTWQELDNSKRIRIMEANLGTLLATSDLNAKLVELQASISLTKLSSSYVHPYVPELQIMSYPGVFSSAKLDQGTKVLLDTYQSHPLQAKSVLDYACGAGVIGLYLQFLYRNSLHIDLLDNNYLAILSCIENIKQSNLKATTFWDDSLVSIPKTYDEIVCNPPFHSNKDEDFFVIAHLCQHAKKHLNKGGVLRLVANQHLPYLEFLSNYFKSVEVIKQKSGFKVYLAKNS